MRNLAMRWFTVGTLFVATVTAVYFPAVPNAEACTAGIEYDIEVTRDDTPTCVAVKPPEPEYRAVLEVDNNCDSSIEFEELGCADSCFEDRVVESGASGEIRLRAGTTEGSRRTTTYAWTIDADEQGMLEAETIHQGRNDACDHWPPTYRRAIPGPTTPQPTTPIRERPARTQGAMPGAIPASNGDPIRAAPTGVPVAAVPTPVPSPLSSSSC